LQTINVAYGQDSLIFDANNRTIYTACDVGYVPAVKQVCTRLVSDHQSSLGWYREMELESRQRATDGLTTIPRK
jgi:hypothetical protein